MYSWYFRILFPRNNTLSKIVNGISISPKKAFSILKIWNRDLKSNNVNILSKKIPHVFLNSSIYKAHNEKK